MTSPRPRRNNLRALTVLVALALCPALGAAPAKVARLHVHGMGWLKNREVQTTLVQLLSEERGEVLDANAVENAVLLVVSTLNDEGYLQPTVVAELTLADGKKTRYTWDASMQTVLPRPLAARDVSLEVKPGLRTYIEKVRINGLKAISEREGRQFFRPENTLFNPASGRIYSPSHARRSADNLQEELRNRGYADATATVANAAINPSNGQVDLRVEVNEGVRWWVLAVHYLIDEKETPVPGDVKTLIGKPWSTLWRQDAVAVIRRIYSRQGYPDVRVRIDVQPSSGATGRSLPVTVTVHVAPGAHVTSGNVRFEGNVHTKESVLRRHVEQKAGESLNVLALDQDRYRISRLGIFNSVELTYDPPDGEVRAPVFMLKEARRWETNLMAGYGSYEQLRGGVEVVQNNLFGLAHHTRLTLVQSMKSSSGEYDYTVPELFGESVDGTVKLFGLRRDERAFERQEYGASFILKLPVQWLGADATAGYTSQVLRNSDDQLATNASDNSKLVVASIDLGLTRDRRDNPLRPRKGYRLFIQSEMANRKLGGQVDYQRIELGGSYHQSIGTGQWLHAGLTHGLIATFGSPDDAQLPVNKRFYPGGDTSIRGYNQGQAAPLDANGQYIGAKSYLLMNVEFEQALTRSWSVVGFFDGLGTTVRLADYPFSERLYSAGLGLRYQALIGPVRLEYGRNLNRRPHDPRGTLHFSVGFPF